MADFTVQRTMYVTTADEYNSITPEEDILTKSDVTPPLVIRLLRYYFNSARSYWNTYPVSNLKCVEVTYPNGKKVYIITRKSMIINTSVYTGDILLK